MYDPRLHQPRNWICLSVQGQCFTATAEKYTYEVCPFGAAAQKEGGSSTRCVPSAADDLSPVHVRYTTSSRCGPNHVLHSCLGPACAMLAVNTSVTKVSNAIQQLALLQAAVA